jgi:hypothetical protein
MPSKPGEEPLLSVLEDIRNWIRAAAHSPVKMQLEHALPDSKSRLAYQMFDGSASVKQVRTKCKLSPNVVVALTSRCLSMGLMTISSDKTRVRLFDLNDFGLFPDHDGPDQSTQ